VNAEKPSAELAVSRIGRVGLIRLDRPEAMNALSLPMRQALCQALKQFADDPGIGAVVVTGHDKVFAAGADVRALAQWDYQTASTSPQLRVAWEQLQRMDKPVIAAVAGYALGAGCELAMMCDFVIAADNARFGQPELRLGTIPGAGGTQRLTRLVGRGLALDLLLTGRRLDAREAERCGLVARVVPLAELLEQALAVATRIAELSAPIVRLAREAVDRALELPLSEGLRFEARLFESSFALEDHHEGISAFLEKRKPVFRNR